MRTAIVFVLSAAMLISAAALSQTTKVERQILVMVKPGTIQWPSGNGRENVERLQMPENLKNLLAKFRIAELSKALPGFRSSDTLKILDGGRIHRPPDFSNLIIIEVPEDFVRDSVMLHLRRISEVIYAEKNQRPTSSGERTPRDAGFPRQWALKNEGTSLQGSGTPGADIRATFAWDITTGSGIKVGIADRGVQTDHEDLGGRVSGYGNAGDSHGTLIAGIIGASGDNPNPYNPQIFVGIAGLNWNAQLLSYDRGGDISASVQAINSAVNGQCKIVNISWTYTDQSIPLDDAIIAGYRAGVLFVTANPENGSSGLFPSSFGPWILSVAATTNSDSKAAYSLDEPYTDVAAPGGSADGQPLKNIYSTIPFSSYEYTAGTSFAAPHVVGTASLMLSANANLRNYDIEHILKRTAKDYPSFTWGLGHGRINAYEAVRRVVGPYSITHGASSLIRDYTNTWWSFDGYPAPGLPPGTYMVDRYVLRADVTFPAYQETPWGWLSITQPGFGGANPNSTNPWIYESVTNTSLNIRTCFYFIKYDLAMHPINVWGPYDPTVFAAEYTILGIPSPPLSVSISGPDWVMSKHYYTYSAGVSGGSGNVSYQWYKSGQALGTAQQQSVYSGMTSYTVSVNVHDNGTGENASASMDVWNDAEGGIAAPQTEDIISMPTEFSIGQNYPNPFNPETQIAFDLPEPSSVRITISDVLGREILTLIDREYAAGYQRVTWKGIDGSGNKVGSGIYFYRITAVGQNGKQFTRVMKMLLAK